MYVYVNRSLLACGQMPTSQLEHLNALWAFAADLHLASGHLLLLYAASASTEASPEMLLVKSAFMRTLCRLVCINLLVKTIVKLPAESETEAFVLFCCFWLQQKFLM